MSKDNGEEARSGSPKVYVEDALILISIGLLFWLGVFERRHVWAQIALGVVLLVMAVVFVRRIKRMHRAFKE